MEKSARKRCLSPATWASHEVLGCGRASPSGPLHPLTLASPKVLSYSQLCAALGVTQDSPDPPTFLSTGEIHAFLSSPSGRRTKRLVTLRHTMLAPSCRPSSLSAPSQRGPQGLSGEQQIPGQ